MIRPHSRAALLVATATTTVIALAGCQDDTGTTPATTSAAPTTRSSAALPTLASATCRTYPHGAQRLGVTIPAGFILEDPAKNRDDLTAGRVFVLSYAWLRREGIQLPIALIAAYAYGLGQPHDDDALQRSIDSAVTIAGGAFLTAIPATTATTAGMPGLTGSTSHGRALNFATPQPGASTVRYWLMNVADAQYVLVLISRTGELDKRYSRELVAGLYRGGCP
jgi:hypothetical protein